MGWVQQYWTGYKQASLQLACRAALFDDMKQQCEPGFELAFSQMCESVPALKDSFGVYQKFCNEKPWLKEWLGHKDMEAVRRNHFNDDLDDFLRSQGKSNDDVKPQCRNSLHHIAKCRHIAHKLYEQKLAKIAGDRSYNPHKERTLEAKLVTFFDGLAENLSQQEINLFSQRIDGVTRDFDITGWYNSFMDHWIDAHAEYIDRYLGQEKFDEATEVKIWESLQYIVGQAFGFPDIMQDWLKPSVSALQKDFGEKQFKRFEEVIIDTLYQEQRRLQQQKGSGRGS